MFIKFAMVVAYATSFIVNNRVAADKSVIVVNQCGHDLQVGYQTNGEPYGQVISVAQGDSTDIPLEDDWAGRVWARKSCEVHDCTLAGAENPASLAEFKMNDADDIDYYDVSFVDGYNLPMRIEPDEMPNDQPSDERHCQPTFCNQIPPCPNDLAFYHAETNDLAGCQSACSRYKEDAYCCTGEHNEPDKCTSNSFARVVKQACPDVYTYPFDDKISVFGCQAESYKVTFCP
ncbi:thaumatin-like protein 1-like [Lichtheimia corymbifera JMRC:FSU:9682]|uniref:Thaumatin-like protein 1-like n=1 Tax=Lichtheimia corymbifera JMRC:FSU:9682 TaxID=1263082 RepID=A0A068SA03_9FUNG|nr:thaumatin-like protein 1-like [Lichtheimia corymbifera JMRC:FSU:9682]